ncbi:hypothetical protein Pst134EA_007207 [Puccinia striiformis f. sp. tritici]|uniref:hypothetical protein n=1 Tax=Puccinia striiformis f. sp. tritici TaxID=168172 RepID=UPI0020085581|nr:hypothetical protein Pst134EA_007207 [Puccinia striiformis f. sp. tritici]KAH9469934.1 hypothetical protein Pst134EA_007207 [Puccinia striiformis f. sp. tritici]
MANSHQDPGITKGGPPGPALNPTITQKETALRELMELVIEADKIKGVNNLDEFSRFRVFFEDITYPLDSREGGSDSDGLTKIFWHCLHQELQGSIAESLIFDGHMILDENFHLAELPHYSILVEYIYRSYISLDYPDEMPTEVPFISEKQLPNQSASLDILGMEEIGENGGQNISEEYGLTLESDWSLQPDLFEESKGLNPSSTSSQSTKAPAIPAKSPRNESNNQPPSFEIPTKAPVMLENQQSNGSVPLDTPGIEENINPETPPQLSDCPSQEEWNFQCHLSEKFTEDPSATTQQLDIKELEFFIEEQSCWSSPPILSSPPPSLPPPILSETKKDLPHNQPENREINQPDIQPTAPTPITNSGKEPCSDGDSKTADQFLKGSNSCRVSTINHIGIKSETQDSSTLINNPEKDTHLERKECPEMKEEFYLPYTPYSPPLENIRFNIGVQNNQLLEDSGTMIISGDVPYNIVTRKALVNNENISQPISYFLLGLMRPSAKLGEEDWAKALELKHIYNFQKTENNGHHTQENLWDDVRSLEDNRGMAWKRSGIRLRGTKALGRTGATYITTRKQIETSGTVGGGMAAFRRCWMVDVGIGSEIRRRGVGSDRCQEQRNQTDREYVVTFVLLRMTKVTLLSKTSRFLQSGARPKRIRSSQLLRHCSLMPMIDSGLHGFLIVPSLSDTGVRTRRKLPLTPMNDSGPSSSPFTSHRSS